MQAQSAAGLARLVVSIGLLPTSGTSARMPGLVGPFLHVDFHHNTVVSGFPGGQSRSCTARKNLPGDHGASLPLHSVGYSKSQGQPRLEGGEIDWMAKLQSICSHFSTCLNLTWKYSATTINFSIYRKFL